MRHARRVPACSALLLVAGFAQAQSSLPSFEERTGWPLPQSGIYFDPAQPGVGFSFDVGLDGSLLGGFGTYGDDGRSIFYTLQGRITRDGLPAADAGTIGVLRSPVYLSRRIGAAGAPDAQVVTEPVPALGTAQVRFTEPRRLVVEIAGQRWNMQRLALTEDPARWIEGRFLMLVEAPAGAAAARPVLAQVAVGPPSRLQVPGGSAPGACGTGGPVAEAHVVACESGCEAFEAWAGGPAARVLIWPNADSSTLQLGRFVASGNQALAPLPGAVQYTLAVSPLSLDALPLARGCSTPGEALRLYRDPAPLLRPPTAAGPPALRTFRDVFGSLRAGTWWDPTRPGSGLVIDVGGRIDSPTAAAFVGVFDFRDDGVADFFNLQGPVYGPDQLGFSPRGLQSPAYRFANGQCLGCPWRAPTAVPSSARMDLRFTLYDNDGMLGVTRVSESGQSQRAVYSRFPLDRSLYDQPLGRWLLRVSDPGFPGVGPGGAAGAFLAEVAIEPLDPRNAESSAFQGSPVHRLRCLAACTAFTRWLAAASPTAEAVLWFTPNRNPDGGLPFDDTLAQLSLMERNGNRLALVEGSRSYLLDLLPLDRYRTFQTGSLGLSPPPGSAGQVELFRNPPRVLRD